jgi:S-formylglutathione hydrolase FrmB
VPGGPQTETFLSKDLPYALKSVHRVGHDAGAWGVMDYSSGGNRALQLTMRNPRVYTAGSSTCPHSTSRCWSSTAGTASGVTRGPWP